MEASDRFAPQKFLQATQIVGTAFSNHPALGDPIVTLFGVKLYAPWNVLIWTAQWTLRDLGMAFVHTAPSLLRCSQRSHWRGWCPLSSQHR